MLHNLVGRKCINTLLSYLWTLNFFSGFILSHCTVSAKIP